jgi:hypothetical protein
MTRTVVVGTTTCAAYMDQEDTWGAWLYAAEAMQIFALGGGYEVRFFAALEVDARGLAPFQPLLVRLAELGGEYWTYSLDDGRTQVTTANRIRHLTMGQNLVNDYCCGDPDVSHLLFMAADTEPAADAIDLLTEVNHPVVGGEVTTYGLHGPRITTFPFVVEEHMATAAFVMLSREAFRLLRWRWDLDEGMTDDPCLHADALQRGWSTYVRKDCIGRHYPEAIGAVETRGHDMTVHRD